MKFRRNRIIILSLFVTLINLFALGCFFTSQKLSHAHHDAMVSSTCCDIGVYDFSQHAGYNLQYDISGNTYLGSNLILFLSLVIILSLKETKFLNYYLIKDRHGGFKLFDKFILLFKKGILQPKLY
ncbi:MAG: hypothetical protein WCV71_02365 [Patescibacteria group bacterium]|jgi:hypothetical protein